MLDSMFSGDRIKLTLAATVLPALLGACALAPGMYLDPAAPVDPTNPESVPHVAAITPQLVRDQKIQRESATLGDFKQLTARPANYVIGPADVLSIIVWEHPELVVPNLTYSIGDTAGTLPNGPGLSTQTVPGFVVGDNGEIQFPYIGKLKAAGKSVAELQAVLKSLLTPYLREPQLTVSVVAYRSQRVFVEGPVGLPGVKPITNVPMSLAEALSEANGITAGVGDTSRIEVIRNGRTFQISLPELAAHRLDASMLYLKDRDVVRVLPQSYNQVFVTGEVMRPVTLPMHDGRLTLSDALASASGVNPATAEPAAIYVVRPTDDPAAPQVFHLDSASPVGLALAEHFELRPKDVVYVDATGLARWNRIVNLLLPSAQGANAGRQIAGY